ncbi:MAG TPA: DNA translocase FtsK [Planctomycetota bacterium]|nr:DNA translocase FtsK [Planctomycetota bacterium]
MAKKAKEGPSEGGSPWREKFQELGALLFVLCAFFVFVSLVTYDPKDIPSIHHPPNDPVSNRGGLMGSRVAFGLLGHFGLAAYLVVFLVGFWSFLVFFRRRLAGLYVKLFAAVVAVFACSTLLSIQPICGPKTFGWAGTMPGLGGIYGKGLEQALTRDLGIAGTWLVVLLAFGVSIVLATDWMIYKGAAAAASWVVRLIGRRSAAKPAVKAVPVILPAKEEGVEEEISRRVTEERRRAAEAIAEEAREPAPSVKLSAPEDESKPPIDAAAPVIPAPKRESRNALRAAAESHSRPKLMPYEQPPIEIFEEAGESLNSMKEPEIRDRIAVIENTLREYEISAKCVHYEIGPATTTFELELAPGTTCSSVAQREAELTMKLAAQVRVVAPIPNKTTVGVEVPNPTADIVRMRSFLEKGYRDLRKIPLPIVLGKTNSGEAIVKSLTSMPHLLIGGSTGSGKSVCLNTIITTLLVGMSWDEMKLILIDPKKVELAPFAEIPHLWAPVIDDARKAAQVLEWLLKEMEDRYLLLKGVQARNIDSFNKLGEKGILERLKERGLSDEEAKASPTFMPYIVVVIDEMANLMQTARKEVELSISTLAAKARAVGIHMICATQRPSTDVITGLIKANMPSRIGFRVASAIESRIILDSKGAERLLGKGDMLTLMAPTYLLQRGQCTFTSDEEIRGVVQFLRSKGKPVYHQELVQIDQASEAEGSMDDELFEDAVRVVLEEQRGSTSLLQRKLQVGYSRASRLIETMEAFGIVGKHNGSSAREILMTWEQWESRRKQLESPAEA